MKGKTCRACGYVRHEEDQAPAGQCPSCNKLYRDTDDASPLNSESAALTSCDDCGGSVSRRAETCPHCGAPIAIHKQETPSPAPAPPESNPRARATRASAPPPLPNQKKRTSPLTMALAVTIGLGVVASITLDTGSGTSGSNSRSGPDEIGACVYAQQFMEQRLRAPSTAEFASCAPRAGETQVEITSRNPYRYTVRTYVDAQNAMGATLREQFVADIERDGDEWRLLDLRTP